MAKNNDKKSLADRIKAKLESMSDEEFSVWWELIEKEAPPRTENDITAEEFIKMHENGNILQK